MGTDIHLFIEWRQPDGSWRLLAPPAPPPGSDSPFWGPHGCMYTSVCYGIYDSQTGEENPCVGAACPKCLGTGRRMDWYHNRNYDVFAILTGTVRNGRGFAGVKTGSGFVGIVSEPRGFPADMDPTTDLNVSHEHSDGWLTLDEILAFDWKQTSLHTGAIPFRDSDDKHPLGARESYVAWRDERRGRQPRSWCGSVWGPDIETISAEQAEQMIADARSLSIDSARLYYVQVEWTETYAESAADFLSFVEHFLVPLGDPKDTRLVFDFDS